MTVQEEIQQCEQSLLQAMRERNMELLNKLIHDDLIFNGPTGEVIDKEMDLSTYNSGDAKIEELRTVESKIAVFGDIATVSALVYLKGSFMDFHINGRARFFRT